MAVTNQLTRRALILRGGAAGLVLSAPMILPSSAKAGIPAIVFGLAGRSLLSSLARMATRSAVSNGLRSKLFENESNFSNQGYTSFSENFSGKVYNKGFLDIASDLFTATAIAFRDVDNIPDVRSVLQVNREFNEARSDYMRSGNVRKLPGYELSKYNSRSTIVLNHIDVIALNFAVSARKREGWSDAKIAACYFPVGVANHHIDHQGKRHGNIQTPTGSINIRSRIDDFGSPRYERDNSKGELGFEISMGANPNLVWCGSRSQCSDVQIGERDRFRGTYYDLL